jgi:uncharacterized protein YqeY
MSPEEKITEGMKVAPRSGDKAKLKLIRMLGSEIRSGEIEKGSELDDDDAVEILSSALKKRREGIEEFRKGGRENLVSQEEEELKTVLSFLPEQFSEGDFQKLIDQSIAETDAQSPRDVEKVIRAVVSTVKGKPDGKRLNRLVCLKLQGE